jgi:hypothetical protein
MHKPHTHPLQVVMQAGARSIRDLVQIRHGGKECDCDCGKRRVSSIRDRSVQVSTAFSILFFDFFDPPAAQVCLALLVQTRIVASLPPDRTYLDVQSILFAVSG